jgi:hypothetical protein
MIIELPFAAPDTAETLAQLGLRVENMTLAQNNYDDRRKVLPIQYSSKILA